ncbi:beta strand repeat-containing protein [Mesoterricola silvestris]|uniref:Uncharacterized protein n=1 Tax=Mesoterricola silvestris TaxID=2927979 RepID=A0AA48KBF3_9BACT|nr:right-handed parallel beta-helix repeat-containing protein [Mesoterricola silvestris]BDU74272.1 hypothetical protein METEAL_34460 [Mesoterricola silvestris]
MANRTTNLGLAVTVGSFLGCLLGCAGGGPKAQIAAPIQVSVSPAQTRVVAGGTASLQATLTGTSNQGLTWSVDGVAGGDATTGTLSGSGTTVTYTAPSTARSHTVTATSVADPTRSGSSTVSVTEVPVPVEVALSPGGPVSVPALGTQTFTATVTGSSNGAVAWTIDGLSTGTSATGTLAVSGASAVYTAPAASGSHTLAAISAADGTARASVAITVTAAPVVAISLSPAGTVNLAASGTQAFTATVTGSSNGAVAWTIDGLSTGTSATGTLAVSGASAVYTAPAASGSHTLAAISAADGTARASVAITVTAAPVVAISLSPAGTVNLAASGTQAFTATVTGSTNTAVGWLVDGVSNGNATVGTLVGSGSTATYTAPAAAGSHGVTAFAAADPARTASATVVVAAPSVSLSLSPSGTTAVYAGGTVAFSASVSGTANTAVTWAVDGVPGGSSAAGTISGSGLSAVYTAPGAAGSHAVTVSSAADATRSASATVTVSTAPASSVSLATVGNGSTVPSGSLLLTAAVANASNPTVTWAVDGIPGGNAATGTVFAPPVGGIAVYTAPSATGSHRITATSAADPSQSASLTLPVNATLVQAASIPIGANVRSSPYNAAGDGVRDDTSAIQAAINAVAGTGKAVYLPAGTYLIDPTANQTGGLRMGSNMTLLLDPKAVIQARSTSTPSYEVITVTSCTNVNITGGTLNGNNLDNTIPTPTATESGDCIHITKSSNVVVEGVVVQNAFNDGVYVGANCSNITICQVTSQFNRRHGMAVTYARGVAIMNSTFHGNTGSIETAGGSWLNGCGIDVEANSGESIVGVLVANNTLSDNRLAGLGWGVHAATGSTTSDIFVIGNRASGNFSGMDGETSSRSWVLGNTVTSNSAYGIYIHTGMDTTLVQGNTVTGTGTAGDGCGIECYYDTATTVDANTCTGNSKYGIRVELSTNPTVTNNVLTGNGIAGLRIENSTGVTQSGN